MKKKIKWKKLIVTILFIIFSMILIISGINIIKWLIDNNKTNKQITEIKEKVNVQEIEDNSLTEVIENEVTKEDPYWDFIKMSLIDVDFNELKKTNKQVKGWIQVNGTNVNYPFVQATNNDYYLTHAFDKSYNGAGWLFMDYRNNATEYDKNTIIYGHSRIDTTMFGSLKNTIKKSWLNNKDNYIIKLSTEKENTMWQIFSIYHIETTSDYLDINFSSDEAYSNFLNLISNRSIHNFNTSVTKDDKILTLSTCYKKTEKIVIHAKLIKKQTR